MPNPLRPALPAALASLFAAAFVSGASSAPPKATLPSPSGRIVYKISGGIGSGTSELAWLDGGKKFRQDTKLKIQQGEKPQTMHVWAFGDGKNLYMHQPMMGKKVLQRPQPQNLFAMAPGGLPLAARGQDTGKVVGKGTVAGKPCEVRQAQNFKMWMWKGIPLKMQATPPQGASGSPLASAGAINMEATKVETTATIAASLLKVPAGYEIQKAPEGAPSRTPGAASQKR